MPASLDSDQLAQACVDRLWQEDRASQQLGMEILSVSEGNAVVAMTVRQDMVNGHDTCHGGMLFSLADSAFAFACNSQNKVAVAANCTIDYIRPAHRGDRLVATSTKVHQGRRSGVYDVIIVNQDDRVIAHFRGRSATLDGSVIQEEVV